VPSRHLLLVRHAPAANGPADADRPLTAGGAQQAAAIGSWLVQAGLVPDRVIVSPARRAAETWDRAAASLGQAPTPVVDARIYANTVEGLLAAIRETPDDVATLAVVGHNPAVGELAGTLDGGRGRPAARRNLDRGFRAGGVAVFDLDLPYAALEPGTATLRDFTVPGG
jgi:phosphohistidine phosphatase